MRWVPPAPPVKVKRSCLCKLLLLSSSLHCMHCGLTREKRVERVVCLPARLPECFLWAAFILLYAATCLCLILGLFSLAFLAPLATSTHRAGGPTPQLQIELVRCFCFFLTQFFALRRWWRNSGLADPIMQTTYHRLQTGSSKNTSVGAALQGANNDSMIHIALFRTFSFNVKAHHHLLLLPVAEVVVLGGFGRPTTRKRRESCLPCSPAGPPAGKKREVIRRFSKSRLSQQPLRSSH